MASYDGMEINNYHYPPELNMEHILYATIKVQNFWRLHLEAEVPRPYGCPALTTPGRSNSWWDGGYKCPLCQVLADVFCFIGAGQHIPESGKNTGCHGNATLPVTLHHLEGKKVKLS